MDERPSRSYGLSGSGLTDFSDDGRKKKIIIIVVLSVILIAVAVTVPTVLLTMKKETNELPVGETDRIECPFMGNPSYDECIKKGCQWSPASMAPSCFLPKKSNYVVTGPKITNRDGFIIPIGYFSNVTLFGSPYLQAQFKVWYRYSDQLAFEISFDNSTHQSVPTSLPFTPIYEVIVDDEVATEFNFVIRRKDDNETIWDSSMNGLILEKQFLQISTHLASENIYGLGENDHPHFKRKLDYKSWTIFSRNSDMVNKKANFGGFHPFYLCLEKSGKAHSVLFDNTHAIEYVLLPTPGITFRTIGGSLKFVIFLGNSPNEAVRLSSDILGKPAIIPYWSLGFQITPKISYDYVEFKAVVEKVKSLIPLDVVYLDPILWDNGKVFDKQHIKDGIFEYVKTLHETHGINFVMTLDPAITTQEYNAFESGLKADVFTKWSEEVAAQIGDDSTIEDSKTNSSLLKKYVLGTREPERGSQGTVAFPDFSKPETRTWWLTLMKNLRQSLVFDGVYLVGNEPFSNGTDTKCEGENCWTLQCPDSEWDNPPYVPGGIGKLSDGSLCMSATLGDQLHYEAHNLYGMRMVEATVNYFNDRSERAFVISQSSTPDKETGNPVGQWLPSQERSWEGLRKTIVGLLDFSLFGIPYVGTQICGDGKLTQTDLCKRWIQLAAFYPFIKVDVRDSNSIDQNLSENGKDALSTRKSLLPYIYTTFYRSHLFGDPVIRPLFYEYPNDENVFSIDKQFLFGESIMIAPVLEEGLTSMDVYFPNDTWYRMRKLTSTIVTYPTGQYSQVGEIVDIPVFVRGGTIFASHSDELTKNIAGNREEPFILKVFPTNGHSSGFLFWDDGKSKDTLKTARYLAFNFTHIMCEVNIQRTDFYNDFKGKIVISKVMVHDCGNAQSVTINDKPGTVDHYSANHKILLLNVDVDLTDDATSVWTIKWSSGGSCLRAEYTDPRSLPDET